MGSGADTGQRWMQRVDELRAFVAQHGRLPRRTDDTHLVEWVRQARVHYPHGRLPAELVAALDTIPGWQWSPTVVRAVPPAARRWTERAQIVAEHVALSGQLPDDPARDGPPADWVRRVRSLHATGRISATATAAFDAIPGWTWDPPVPVQRRVTAQHWVERAEAIRAFHQAAGELPTDDTAARLAQWAQYARQRGRSRIPPAAVAVLEAIPGWSWWRAWAPASSGAVPPAADAGADPGLAWRAGLDAVVAFVAEHGRLPGAADGQRFVSWMASTRAAFWAGRLPPAAVEQVETVPGWWWRKSDRPRTSGRRVRRWQERAAALAAFVAAHGHLPRVEDDLTLHSWVGAQRARYRDGRLSADQTATLAAIPGWWWTWADRARPSTPTVTVRRFRRGAWHERAAQVRDFVAVHGRLPRVADDRSLAAWMAQQRDFYRRQILPADLARELAQIPGWWWTIGNRRVTLPAAAARRHPRHGRSPAMMRDDVARLAAFQVAHGRLPVGADDLELARIAGRFRSQRRAGRLPAEIGELLDTIPGWDWGPAPVAPRQMRDDEWVGRVTDLTAFVDRHHRPPRWRAEDLAERSLAVWYAAQVKRRNEFLLGADRAADIDALTSRLESFTVHGFDARVAELAGFVARHGRLANVTASDPAEARLGRWVATQRGLYRNQKLEAERVAMLDAVPGWSWEADWRDQAWEHQFAAWSAFVDTHGRIPVRNPSSGTETALAAWASVQRQRQRAGQLDASRQARLDAHPAWQWEQRRRATTPSVRRDWMATFGELVAFHDREHRLPSTAANDAEERRLAQWVSNQRAMQRSGRLSVDRTGELEALGWWQWADRARPRRSWQDTYAALRVFVASNGRLPGAGDPRELGRWCSTQRGLYHDGVLSPASIARLEELPGWEWGTPAVRPAPVPWAQRCDEVAAFKAERGRLPNRPSDDPVEHHLAVWLVNQYARRGGGKMPDDELQRFNELTGRT